MGKKCQQQQRRRLHHHRRISSSPSIITSQDQSFVNGEGVGRVDDDEERAAEGFLNSSQQSYTEEDNDNDDDGGVLWENAAYEYDQEDNYITNSHVEPSSSSFGTSTTSRQPSLPPYVNVAPLPTFHGLPEECAVAHLTRFARVCRANDASSTDTILKIFPVTLLDEASLWYELTIEPDPSLTWLDIKSIFLDTYRRPEESRSELMSIKQKGHESVKSYYMRLQWVLIKWPEHGMKDEVLKEVFVEGLRVEECCNWVVLQRPKSLDEAFGVALDWERAESVKMERNRRNGERVGANSRCGFCEGVHLESRCELRRKMRELWLSSRNTDERSGSAEKEEDGGGGEMSRGGGGGGGQQQQCKCWRHRCWKKFDRSASAPVDRASSSLALLPNPKHC